MLPVTLTTAPVCDATFTMLVNIPLLAVMLPTALTSPPVNKLPPVTLPVILTTAPVKLATFTTLVNMPLLALTLPLTLNKLVFDAKVNPAEAAAFPLEL